MRQKTIVAGVLLAAAVLGALCVSYSRSNSAVAKRIPDTVKQKALSTFDQSQYGPPRWRGYVKDGSSEMVVLEVQMASQLPHSSPFSLFFFVILKDGQITGTFAFSPDGSKFQAHAGNGTHIAHPDVHNPTELTTPDQWVFGTAFDRRVALVRVSTADGRTAEVRPFDGCWWLESRTSVSTLVEDKWIQAVALDSSGRVLYQRVPEYPANWPYR